jgi:hypothetical protein
LRRIWGAAQDQASVIAAAEQINIDLSRDPDTLGRITDGYRVHARSPVSVLYLVAHSVHVVWVIRATPRWVSPQQPGSSGTP